MTIDDFVGDWRGVEVSIDAPGQSPKLAPADLDMTISRGRTGASGSVPFALGREPDGALRPSPLGGGVRADRQCRACSPSIRGTGSLLSSLFADPAVGNPLEGDTLLWARLQDDTLHVYSLAIDPTGGFALEHSTGRLTERRHGGAVRAALPRTTGSLIVEGRLERAGD